MKGAFGKEVIYGGVRGLDKRISDCKLAIHANCFYEIQKNMIHDLGSIHNGVRNRSNVISLKRLKSCCHYSLQDLCVHTNGAHCGD